MQLTSSVVDRQDMSDLEPLQLIGVLAVAIVPHVQAGQDLVHTIPHVASLTADGSFGLEKNPRFAIKAISLISRHTRDDSPIFSYLSSLELASR